MSIEDSLILSTLLGRAKTPVEVLTALKVYDQVRRPRTQRIVESSRATGDMLTGTVKLDPKTLNSCQGGISSSILIWRNIAMRPFR